MRAMPRALFAILLVGLLVLAGCVQEPPPASPFNGQEFDNGMHAPLFTLESMDGELWSLEEQRGKTVVMAFIYTRCYETCPVISAAINHAKTKLTSEENLSVVWVSITIDPDHDSPSVLQNWTSDRGYDWVHLTGIGSAVNPVLDAYDVDPIGFEDNSSQGYGFSHPQPTYVIDSSGYLRVVWSEVDWPVDLFLEDLRTVLAG